MAKHDTSQPILVLIRRGRKNRGFSVSPVEDVANISACGDEKELGEVIREMLDDPEQPRVNINDLIRASAGVDPGQENEPDGSRSDNDNSNGDEGEEEDEDEDESPTKGSVLDGVAEASDPFDRLLFNVLERAVRTGQKHSSKRVSSTGRSRKKRRK